MVKASISIYLLLADRYDQIRKSGSERGLTTTEVAVLTFILVAMAVAVGTILWNYVNGRVSNLPENVTPEIPE